MLPRCPVCKYYLVAEKGLVCDACYGVECSHCHQPKEFLERFEADGEIKFVCQDCLSSPIVYNKFKGGKTKDYTKFQFQKKDPNYAKCLGCGDTLMSSVSAFCSSCLESIKAKLCVECLNPTNEIDETGRCPSCSETHSSLKYLTSPQFPPCACGVYEAPYAGAVCRMPECVERHNARLCPACNERYIKPTELMCNVCLKQKNKWIE